MKNYNKVIILSFLLNSILLGDFIPIDLDIDKYLKNVKKYITRKDKNKDSAIDYTQPISLKLNTSTNRFDQREWIPYIDETEIPLSIFWELIGNKKYAEDWIYKEKVLSKIKKDRFHLRRLIVSGYGIFAGLEFHKKVEYDDDVLSQNNETGVRTRITGKRYEHNPNYIIAILSSGIFIYEILNPMYGIYLKIIHSQTEFTNKVDHHIANTIVSDYNMNLIKE